MTGTLARMAARRPVTVIGVWVALAAIAGALNLFLLPGATTPELRFITALTDVESDRADELLKEGQIPASFTEAVVVQSETLTVEAAPFREKVDELTGAVRLLGGDTLGGVHSYYESGDERLVSADRMTTVLLLPFVGEFAQVHEHLEELFDLVLEADGRDGFRVLLTGDASIIYEGGQLVKDDLERGELVALPLALLILFLLFGAVVAALIPIGLAVLSIGITLAIVALIGSAFGELSLYVTVWVTTIGLAVGIDYSLLVVSRFREEYARGLDTQAAVVRAGATAARTVLFSGMTVIIALVGVLIIPYSLFFSQGLGAILVVAVTVLATLTLLPAILALLGPRVDLLRFPWYRKGREASAHRTQDGFWDTVTRKAMRFSVLSVIVVAGLLIWIAAHYLDMKSGFNGVEILPEQSRTRDGFEVLDEQFTFGYVNPARVVIHGDLADPRVQAAVQSLGERVDADPAMGVPVPAGRSGDNLALFLVPVSGGPGSEIALDAISRLRDEYTLEAFGDAPVDVFVGGRSAAYVDIREIVNTFSPIVIALILALSFIVVVLVFRSIVIAIKAILMNLLSVGAAYGLVVLVFQDGIGADLLGFQRTPTIDVWVPLVLFAVLFGLSMDYHVFLLSRIRERYIQTQDTAEAVALGLRSTASMITGAALIMVAVFAGFASGDMVLSQQIGFGLAAAIFIDATLVRSILVPSSMQLLGGWNWYLPRPLQWIPTLHVEADEPETVSTVSPGF